MTKSANKIAAVIPESATHDPHAWITDACVPWQTAGLFLGFAMGWRLATGLGGKDGAR